MSRSVLGLALVASVTLAPVLFGCAGSGGTVVTGEQFTLTAFAGNGRTGSVYSDGFVDLNNIRTGDSGIPSAVIPQGVTPQGLAQNAQFRGFVSFNLPALPPGAVLVSATLEMTPADYFESPQGTLFASMGNVVIDHVSLGAGLDAGDYGAAALASNVNTLLAAVVTGPQQADVSSSVANDYGNARAQSEFRVRFTNATDADSSQDSVDFGGPFSKGGEPRLIIVYAIGGFGTPYLPHPDELPD